MENGSAYTSIETGQNQIFVQPVPITGSKYQISKNGGHHALWSPDGRELVYDVTAGLSEIVSLTFQPTLAVGKPKVWPRGNMLFSGGTSPRPVDMSPDGRMVGAVSIGDNDDTQNARGHSRRAELVRGAQTTCTDSGIRDWVLGIRAERARH